MPEKRPNPEKLLHRAQEEARRQNRGKLKIYLGAAPGVGKTHEMLTDALHERTKGLDVVVGIAESHERKEINALLKDFEVLPRQKIEYHDKKLLEFDLDAALRRHPGLILMDEMAHTNVPNVRHTKRWQDIKELLDRGIDVYTTLNVQHIESLNDDVRQIIHAPVKETVPDSMIEMADTIELIDIPVDELLKRLQEGKVYIPQQATLAAEHYFRKGNLTALRELALRTTAERVSTEVLLYRQGEGIKYIWPTKDKILVCVGPKPESLKLIRAAKRIATSLQAEWIAVYVDTPKFQASEQRRESAILNLRLAAQLGAETRVLSGFDIVKEIMNFAREQNVTQIMIWKRIGTRWRDWFRRSLTDELVRNSGEIDVYMMTGEPTEVRPQKTAPKPQPFPLKTYVIAVGIVALVTCINILLFPYLAASNLIMIYLLGVIAVSLFGKSGPAILASVLSVLAYDFFFVAPFYTFAVTDIEYLITFLIMLLVAQVISHLIVLTGRQIESSRLVQHQTSALYSLSHKLSSTRGVDKLLDIGTQYLADSFDSEVLAFLPKNNCLEVRGASKKVLDEKEQSVAQWVYELGQMAGFGTDTLSFSKALYVPLSTSQGTIGVLRIYPKKQQLFTPEQMRLLEACSNQIALAIEVDRLQEKAKQKELQMATDVVRNSLLQSMSHDLRTPLVAVIGAASVLIEIGETLERKKIKEIGKEIYYETEQLSRLINNLLQITYLEAPDVKLQIAPSDLEKVISLVVKTSSKKLKDRPVQVNIPENLPHVPFDHSLIQEVLLNLIDNAVKFTPPKSPIDIHAKTEKNKIIVSIEDRGPGIMMDEVNLLFEKFYRGRLLTTERGLGLGLAICRIIIEAHGGKIWAENLKEGGVAFRFILYIDKSHG